MKKAEVVRIVELGLLCAAGPCSARRLAGLFTAEDQVDAAGIKAAVEQLAKDWEGRALELTETASGWQLRSKGAYRDRARRFLEASPPRLSRPLLEVLAIVAYHQEVTRGDIEEIRGVTTSANQLATLEELGWVEVSGRRETPGRPLVYATTAKFLDDIGLASLDMLPPLEDFSADLPIEVGEVDDGEGDDQPGAGAQGAQDDEEPGGAGGEEAVTAATAGQAGAADAGDSPPDDDAAGRDRGGADKTPS